MAYSTLKDLQNLATAKFVLGTTNDAKQGLPGADIIESVIGEADSLIDSYLTGIYAIPLATRDSSPLPPLITRISASLAVYFLYLRRYPTDTTVPEPMRFLYSDSIQHLQRIGSGTLTFSSLVVADETSDTAGVIIATNNDSSKLVFPDRLLDRI